MCIYISEYVCVYVYVYVYMYVYMCARLTHTYTQLDVRMYIHRDRTKTSDVETARQRYMAGAILATMYAF